MTYARKKMIATAFIGIVFMAALTLGSSGCSYIKDGKYVVNKFKVGQGRSINIWADHSWEISQGFYYEVVVNDEIVVPKAMICGGEYNSSVRFKTISAKSGNLIGIFVEKHPEAILALHDFSSNMTWPRPDDNESPMEHGAVGIGFLDELQKENPNIKFKLGSSGCV